MYFLEELQPLKLYKRQFVVPFNKQSKRHGSIIFLMSPSLKESIAMTNNPLIVSKYFNSLYIERNAVLYANNESVISDGDTSFISTCNVGDIKIDGNCLRLNIDESHNMLIPLNEAENYDAQLRKIVYNDRMKSIKDLEPKYETAKQINKDIKYTYYSLDRYKGLNLYVDLSFYLDLFNRNNIYTLKKGMEIYTELLTRLIRDEKYAAAGYNKKTIFIDLKGWLNLYADVNDMLDYKRNINPLSMIMYMLFMKHESILNALYKDFNMVIIGPKSYMKLNLAELHKSDMSMLKTLINKLGLGISEDNDPDIDSQSVIVMKAVEDIEKASGIHLDNIAPVKNLVGDKPKEPKKVVKAATTSAPKPVAKAKIRKIKQDKLETDKAELVDTINNLAKSAQSAEEVIDDIDRSEYEQNLIQKIAQEEDNKVKISAARVARINKQQQYFLNKTVKGKKIKDAIQANTEAQPLEETSLKIDSINEEWQHLTFTNFEKAYDLNGDIVAILNFFATRSTPVVVRDIKVEDTTTSEDYIETYYVDCEDVNGKRFRLVFDVPKIKNNRFMRLRGNDKVMNGQLVLIPCVKTDEDTVQLVSNYNKIFIRRYNTATGKSCPKVDKIIKALAKYEGDDINVIWGDTTRICSKYELPYNYIDLASGILKIETPKYIIYTNQDEIRSVYNLSEEELMKDHADEIPFAYNKTDKTIVYGQDNIVDFIYGMLQEKTGMTSDFINEQSVSSKYTYSKASILNTEIPVIVVLGYSYGLTSVLASANIPIVFREKAPSKKEQTELGYIKFKDGYLIFDNYGPNAMLLNGLKDCPTEDYSVDDINSKAMWMDFLDAFGGRIKADGLDNFVDLFVDPKTAAICDIYKIPNDYKTLMLNANIMLCDNKYNRHVDVTGNRYRTNEIIAGYAYKCLATSYGAYTTALKRNRTGVSMSIKRTAILDAILVDPTCSDLSKGTPLLEKESSNTVGFKGLSGMNSDRSYGVDKRTYDDTMINKIALSTGFAANAGISRQATIDMDIESNMGLIKDTSNPEDMSITKTFSITEAMTPFGTTRDDPFRSAMTFIQTSKHSMRTNISHPLLVTNGADEAMPYMTSDTFAWKAKGAGKIVEKTDDYMVIEYDDPNIPAEFVDLRETVEKNSDGGFFITIQLESDLKVGDKVKQNDIVAYDHKAYNNMVGATDNIAAVPGTLAKLAILNTDEGFEDSTIFTNYLSVAMGSEIVTKKDKVLDKNTNVYFLIKKGTPVQEGDPLLIFQNAFDDKDANLLLKNLTPDGDDDGTVSELGRITIKSKYTGVVQDVKIYRTTEIDELSPSLKKIVTAYESDIKKYKKVMMKHKTDDIESFDADYKLEATGNLKDCPDGVKIVIYVKYFDKMSVGDKIVNWSALKGVSKDVIEKGKEPYSEFRPEEEISSLLTASSVDGRMVTSIMIVGTINKGLIELDRAVKEIMGIPYKSLQEYDKEQLRKQGLDV